MPGSVVIMRPINARIRLPNRSIYLCTRAERAFRRLHKHATPLQLFQNRRLYRHFRGQIKQRLPGFHFNSLRLPRTTFPIGLRYRLLVQLIAPRSIR